MKLHKVLVSAGLLLLAAALALTGYNIYANAQAEKSVNAALEELAAIIPTAQVTALPQETEAVEEVETTSTPEPTPTPTAEIAAVEEMPSVVVEEQDYIGTLNIPALSLTLPIISEWSYPRLKVAPCRYSGSVYSNDLIICAHNYASHFGKLKDLVEGDSVSFTDLDGNCFNYTVSAIETMDGTAVEEMESGSWDLTLFTCTVGGAARIAVRCTLSE